MATTTPLDEMNLAEALQSAPPLSSGRRRWFTRFGWLAAIAVAAAVLYYVNPLAGWIGEGANAARIPTVAPKLGNLLVTVTEDGDVESASNVDIRCEVAGGSTILWIIKDGTQVKKGKS
jgi:hypothetical protein